MDKMTNIKEIVLVNVCEVVFGVSTSSEQTNEYFLVHLHIAELHCGVFMRAQLLGCCGL